MLRKIEENHLRYQFHGQHIVWATQEFLFFEKRGRSIGMTFDDATYSECKLTESPMVIIDQVKMEKILEAKFKFRLSVFLMFTYI